MGDDPARLIGRLASRDRNPAISEPGHASRVWRMPTALRAMSDAAAAGADGVSRETFDPLRHFFASILRVYPNGSGRR